MGALAQLSQSRVEVEPGRTATVTVTVRNTGTVVDRYTFEVLGAAAPWVRFSPDSLSLFPEASGTVNLVLAPPREPTVHAGPTPMGVRITSSEDPEGSVVEEGTIDVGAFSDITLELVPRVARGRVVGRAQLAVDNRSNCSYRARAEGTDPQMALQFRFRPAVVDIAPGGAQFVKVAIRPSSRFWKGPERTRPFRLVLRDDQAEPDQVGVLVGTLPPAEIAGVESAEPADSPTVGRTGTASPVTRAPGPAPAEERTPDGTGAAPGDWAAAEAVPADLGERVPSPHKEEISTDGSLLQEPLLPRWLLAAAGALVALAVLAAILWFALFKPQVKSTAQNEVNKQLAANGITPVNPSKGSKTGSGGGNGSSGTGGGSGGSSATTVPGGGARRERLHRRGRTRCRVRGSRGYGQWWPDGEWRRHEGGLHRAQRPDAGGDRHPGGKRLRRHRDPHPGPQWYPRDVVVDGQLPGSRLPLDHPDHVRPQQPDAAGRGRVLGNVHPGHLLRRAFGLGMSWTSRRRRLRVLGAVSATFALGAGLVFASAVAGHSPRASANPTGASPGVYEAAIGNVDTLSLSTLQAGTSVSGAKSSVIYGPVGVNVNATKVLVGQEPPEVGVIDVQGNVRSPAVPLAGRAIAVAMDPANANVAFVLEANANPNAEALVQEVNMGASPPGGPAVTSLGAGLPVFAPTSIAISPSGATLYVAGTVGDGLFGIEAIPVANPTHGTVWSAAANEGVSFAGGVVSVALGPDGLNLYGAATRSSEGGNGAVFDLGLPLAAGEKVRWFEPTAFTPTALTVNPNGDTVYAGGSSGLGSNSTVQAFAAATGTPGIQSKPIPMRAANRAVMGLTSMAVTPDGDTLLATGTDGTTPTSPVVVYPLGLPNLGIGARTTFGNLSSSSTASPAIAITPDQAPVARILAPVSVQVNQPVTFDASASTVAYGSVSSFAWQFGDGKTASGVTATHTYSAPGTYNVTLTETDHAGTGLTTGVAGVSGPVAGPGQTPFRLASVSAQTSVPIGVTPTPTTLTTAPPPTPPTVPVLTTPTTPTVPTSTPGGPGRAVPAPTLTLNPGVGPPGTIVTVSGAGFQPNTPVTVAWSTSTGSVVDVADARGDLPPVQLNILTPDVLGPRFAIASSSPPASAPFLVVPSDSEPGGGSGDFLFRSEGP